MSSAWFNDNDISETIKTHFVERISSLYDALFIDWTQHFLSVSETVSLILAKSILVLLGRKAENTELV